MNQPNFQITFCGYATKQDVMNWMVSPGYMLIFMDPDQTHMYRKSLAYGTYQTVFEEFELLKPVQTNQPEPLVDQVSTNSAIQQILDRLNDFDRRLNEMSNRNNKPYYQNKKDGDKQ